MKHQPWIHTNLSGHDTTWHAFKPIIKVLSKYFPITIWSKLPILILSGFKCTIQYMQTLFIRHTFQYVHFYWIEPKKKAEHRWQWHNVHQPHLRVHVHVLHHQDSTESLPSPSGGEGLSNFDARVMDLLSQPGILECLPDPSPPPHCVRRFIICGPPAPTWLPGGGHPRPRL